MYKSIFLITSLFFSTIGYSQVEIFKEFDDLTEGEVSSIFQKDGGNDFYFTTYANRNYDLWYSDGDINNTIKLASFPDNGFIGTNPNINTKERTYGFANGKFIFRATVNGNNELWSSGGTVSSTQKIADLDGYPGYKSVSTKDHFFFTINSNLYCTDGTPGNLDLIYDGYIRGHLATFEGKLVYITNASNSSINLYDPVTSSATLLHSWTSELQPGYIFSSNDNIYAHFHDANFKWSIGIYNFFSSKFDIIHNYAPGATNFSRDARSFFNIDGDVYFGSPDINATSSNFYDNHYYALWKISGSDVVQLIRVLPTSTTVNGFPSLVQVWEMNNKVYATFRGGTTSVFSTDGTPENTLGLLSFDTPTQVPGIQTNGERAFFFLESNNGIQELTDSEIKDLVPFSTSSVASRGFAFAGENVFFTLDENTYSEDMWYFNIGADSDNDGVLDLDDLCLNTESGSDVDEFGCQIPLGCESGYGITGIYDDFSLEGSPVNGEGGVYDWEEITLEGDDHPNYQLISTRNQVTQSLDLIVTQGSNYVPFGFSFGVQNNISNTIDLSGNEDYELDIVNNSNQAVTVNVGFIDIDDNIINTYSSGLNTPFNEAWQHSISFDLSSAENKLISNTFENAVYADYESNTISSSFDFSRVKGIMLTFVAKDGGALTEANIRINSIRIGDCSTASNNVDQSLLDDDNDGVVNSQDLCQNTSIGVDVDSDGCSPEQLQAIGLEESEFQGINIYPNPTNAMLYIDQTEIKFKRAIIRDLKGKEIGTYSIEGSQFKIETSSMSSGVYLLNLQNKHTSIVTKFIVN